MPSDPNDPKTWGRMTCVLGFPVMGIWPDFADGTDVNALHVNIKGDVCVTADDFGEVKIFNFPCVTEDSKFRAYKGHSSFVNNVAFAPGDAAVISCGSADMSVMQWKFTYQKTKGANLKKAMAKFTVSNAFKSKSLGETYSGESGKGDKGGGGFGGLFTNTKKAKRAPGVSFDAGVQDNEPAPAPAAKAALAGLMGKLGKK